jgi:hypothetical protein
MAYLFDPDRLHEITKKVVGLPHEEMIKTLIDELAAVWPGHIETRQQWIFNIAGGVTGVINVLHGSLTEYLLLFGSPIGSEGFSGRYRLDIWDAMLAGDMWTFTDAAGAYSKKNEYKPGDLAFLPRGTAKGVKVHDGAWMLEYARGPVPTALPFALATAMDGPVILDTIKIYGRLVIKELLQGKI